MNEQELTFKFFDILPDKSEVYGEPKDQALLFQDIIPWPDPDQDQKYYELVDDFFTGDETNSYTMNKMYMREPVLTKNVELLTVGCSNSFGVGLPLAATWPKIVSENLNVKYANISIAGSSVMHEIMNIFHFCQTFGNPKIILCMFPNFERSRFFVDNKFTQFKNKNEEITGPMHIYTDRLIEKPRFLKFPVGKDDFIAQPHAFYNNSLFVFMLEQYCKSNNIKLVWSSWAHYGNFDKMFEKVYKNYRIEPNGFYNDNIVKCNDHEHLRNNFPGLFDEGSDLQKHPGFHWHTHIANFFLNELKNI